MSVTSFRSRSVRATSGERPIASRSASVRWAVNSMTNRSVILRQVSTDRLAIRHDDGSDMSGIGMAITEIAITPLPRHRRISTVLDRDLLNRLILWTHIAAIDCERAMAVERDERPCPPALLRVEDQWHSLEFFHGDLQPAKPRVDLVGDFILTRVFVLQRPLLGEQLGMGRAFVIRHR